MTYAEKLKDPMWLLRREEILTRDAHVCADCFATESIMHVHHLYYEYGNEPWEYPDSALITLCEGCHTEEHSRWSRYEGFDRDLSLRKEGFMAKDYENLLYSMFGEKIGIIEKGGAVDDCRKMIKRRKDAHSHQIKLRKKELGIYPCCEDWFNDATVTPL